MITYRDATLADAPALASLSRDTFIATFGHLYPPADLAAFLAKNYTVQSVSAELSEPETEFRSASDGELLVGYYKLGAFKLPFDTGGRRALELHRLYVIERVKGGGVAAVLMDRALERMRARGAEDAYLGVYQDNVRAQRFYKRYGFEIVGAYKYPVGETLDDEFILRMRLA